eukprot:TRINITY_DN773_c0_g1_i2.p1 TRINITY_DN773_c0_g1~~TRINITY_DN773_c0_g1_i2.p1  ORF type:complete len:133 (+),score=20.78 TRINITY_DN773_c0_g1_i2:57-401(+)
MAAACVIQPAQMAVTPLARGMDRFGADSVATSSDSDSYAILAADALLQELLSQSDAAAPLMPQSLVRNSTLELVEEGRGVRPKDILNTLTDAAYVQQLERMNDGRHEHRLQRNV